MVKKAWSDDLINFTKRSPGNLAFVSNPKLEGVVFKNIDGRFGHIKTADAFGAKYLMHIIGEETLMDYPDAESLVASGWVID